MGSNICLALIVGFRKAIAEATAADADTARKEAIRYPSRGAGAMGGPGVVVDESMPLASARKFMEVLCAAAEGAGVPGRSGEEGGWRGFKAKVGTDG